MRKATFKCATCGKVARPRLAHWRHVPRCPAGHGLMVSACLVEQRDRRLRFLKQPDRAPGSRWRARWTTTGRRWPQDVCATCGGPTKFAKRGQNGEQRAPSRFMADLRICSVDPSHDIDDDGGVQAVRRHW